MGGGVLRPNISCFLAISFYQLPLFPGCLGQPANRDDCQLVKAAMRCTKYDSSLRCSAEMTKSKAGLFCSRKGRKLWTMDKNTPLRVVEGGRVNEGVWGWESCYPPTDEEVMLPFMDT